MQKPQKRMKKKIQSKGLGKANIHRWSCLANMHRYATCLVFRTIVCIIINIYWIVYVMHTKSRDKKKNVKTMQKKHKWMVCFCIYIVKPNRNEKDVHTAFERKASSSWFELGSKSSCKQKFFDFLFSFANEKKIVDWFVNVCCFFSFFVFSLITYLFVILFSHKWIYHHKPPSQVYL